MDKSQLIAQLAAASNTRSGVRLLSNRVYTIHEGAGNLPPQARAILIVMLKEDADSWTEPELYDLLMSHTEISKKQTPWEVFAFYRARLVETGWIVYNK